MSDTAGATPSKSLRAGTRSCIECRRRKIKCVWPSAAARKCLRCKDRSIECTAQTLSQPTHDASKTLRERVLSLERQVYHLTQITPGAELKGGFGSEPLTTPSHAGHDVDSDGDSGLSEDLENPPSHLRSLFDNAMLSSEHHETPTSDGGRPISTDLLRTARSNLQSLVPPREDVAVVSPYASRWLFLYNSLLPHISVTQRASDLLAQYDGMVAKTVHPASLAAWLIALVITIQSIPPGDAVSLTISDPSRFCQVVANAVGNAVVSNDTLAATQEGLETMMLYTRLRMSRGSFRQSWLGLRRMVALAELAGLPMASRDIVSERTSRQSELWTAICTSDRIAAMMFNIPAGTRGYPSPSPPVIVNGQFISSAYLRNLANIAVQIQSLDGGEVPDYAEALKIDHELSTLSRQMPPNWWKTPQSLIDSLLQSWHNYLTLRTHVRFVVQRQQQPQQPPQQQQVFEYSHTLCKEVCVKILHLFLLIRQSLPHDFFLIRVFELQLFTAAVTHLLIQGDPAPVKQVVDAMQDSSHSRQASGISRKIASSLAELLQMDQDRDITIKVPLMGELRVKKRTTQHAVPQQQQQHYQPRPHPPPQEDAARPNNVYFGTTMPELPANLINTNMNGVTGGWSEDPFLWTIEGGAAFGLDDAFLLDGGESDFLTW